MKLSDRLQIIAEEIKQNETMADIGTDHGFLPIYLWEKKISPKVIMADVSRGSLDKAAENCRIHCPDAAFDLRLGNGLRVLEAGETDAVVLAGMGGILMTEILGDDLKKAKSFKTYILQPRSGQGKLRRWLLENGFFIAKESLVREGKYICEVLTVCPEENPGREQAVSRKPAEGEDIYGDIWYEVPPWIFTAGELSVSFVENKLAAQKEILANLGKSKAADREKEAKIKENILYLENLLEGRTDK